MSKAFPNPAEYPAYPECCNKEMGLDSRQVKAAFVCMVCDRQLLVEDHYVNAEKIANAEEMRDLRVALEIKCAELREAARIIAELKEERNGLVDKWGGS